MWTSCKRTVGAFDFFRRHDECRIFGEVFHVMLVCIWCVGRGVEVFEERFKVGVEIEFGKLRFVVAHLVVCELLTIGGDCFGFNVEHLEALGMLRDVT